MIRTPRLLLALALLVTPAAAGTLTVGPPGSGAGYSLLGDALAAAGAGDTILVLPGQYVEVAPIVIDKPLSILGAGSDLSEVQLSGGVFVLDLAPLLPVGHVVLDASGAGVVAIGVPPQPALVGKELALQSVGFSPSATLTLHILASRASFPEGARTGPEGRRMERCEPPTASAEE